MMARLADHIIALHLKNANQRICPLLVIHFSGVIVHGVLEESIISVLLVLVIKDKAGKLNSMDDYKHIAFASFEDKVGNVCSQY